MQHQEKPRRTYRGFLVAYSRYFRLLLVSMSTAPDARPYLPPSEVMIVAERVADLKLTPLRGEMQDIREMLRRLVGDDPKTTSLPESLQYKGLITELKEQTGAQFAQQIKWKAEQDRKDTKAAEERKQLQNDTAELKRQFEGLEKRFNDDQKQRHKIRRLLVYFVRWCTRKDDRVSIFVGKAALVTSGGVSAVAVGYHGMKWVIVHLFKLLIGAMR